MMFFWERYVCVDLHLDLKNTGFYINMIYTVEEELGPTIEHFFLNVSFMFFWYRLSLEANHH